LPLILTAQQITALLWAWSPFLTRTHLQTSVCCEVGLHAWLFGCRRANDEYSSEQSGLGLLWQLLLCLGLPAWRQARVPS